ncbi:ABC transporter permease [Phocaeicola sp.]|uniref:ABC transporter permease n=1 Tax=Phocaeicola sp. TaxID=2773926 RepID=UPI0023C41E7D|nr:ABC transporter permease [Phocaeicola sp.]MDE5677581.1 ABC transporter permease [Phocaeicola sp.]
MIAHYIKVAFRNLLKYKTQSIISIAGLAIGIAFFVFSLYWLHYETSYDSFYPDANRTYMISLQTEGKSNEICPIAMVPFIQEKCPEVETVTCTAGNSGFDFTMEEKELKHPDFQAMDSLFMKCFPQKIVYGTEPTYNNEILLSESFARKYWHHPQDAIGSLLTPKMPKGFYMPNPLQVRVSGIMADAPENSSFQHDGYYLCNYENIDYHQANRWKYIANTQVHVVLKKGIKLRDFSQHLHTLLQELGREIEVKNIEFNIIPLYQKHFEFAAAESFSYSSIRMFTIASLLLLCCVLFNFINLFLNRYYQRLREMKLRKSTGANYRKLIELLLIEVLFHCLLAGMVCCCLIEIFTPFFDQILSITIQGSALWIEFLKVFSTFIIATVVLLVLPVWQIVHVSISRTLTSKPHTHRSTLFRKFALVVQLIICLFFLTSTAMLYRQINFMKHTDWGFDTQNIIELMVQTMEQNGQDMLEEIKRLPMIQAGTTASSYIITHKTDNFLPLIEWEGKTEEDGRTQIARLEITKGGEDIFKFRLIEGRMFAEEDWTANSDSPKDAVTGKQALNKVLITKKMADLMRMDEPVGKILRIPIILFQDGPKTYYTDYEIIGVIKDIHPQGMKSESYPTVIMQSFRFVLPLNYFKVVPGTEEEALRSINALAKKYQWEYYAHNAEPQTLDDKLEGMSKSETATYRLFSILSALCIIISLFGIFSISSSTIRQRRKEIAVRKIMGANTNEIIGMFFREYLWMTCIAAVIAFPCMYVVMHRWLEQYAYHISIHIGPLIAWLGIVIILVLLTILQQVVQAARQNPAEVIKSE